MSTKEYPIGTKIRYNGCHRADVGKNGTIVGYVGYSVVRIVVPKSDLALELFGDSEHSWTTFTHDIEILPQGGQLTFSFYKQL